MRRAVVVLVALAVAGTVLAAGNQAYLGIFAETSQMKMIGMHMPKLPPSILKRMPANVRAMMAGAPKRGLTVRLWSPGIAPDNAFATLAIPDGLKLGPKLNLDLYRPKAEVTEGGGGEAGPGNFDMTKFTIKLYWGSSPTVKPGQPVVLTFGDLTPAEQAAMKRQASRARAAARRAQAGAEYFYKPDWTTGYWPTKEQPGTIAPDATMPGHYALTTNYTGNVALDVPNNVDFLPGFDLTSPDLSTAPPLDQPIAFKWKLIPNLLGSHMQIMGMIGQNTLIIWSSSEIREGMNVDWDYMQMADVRRMVKTTEMMGPDRTDCTVPAGIFQDCDTVFLRWIGYGPGAALAKAQPLPRVQTKTTLQMMLGGKRMPKMPAMGGMGNMGNMGAGG